MVQMIKVISPTTLVQLLKPLSHVILRKQIIDKVNPGSKDFNTGNEDFNTGSLGTSKQPIFKRTDKLHEYRRNLKLPKELKHNSNKKKAGSCRSYEIASITGGRGWLRQVHLDALLAKRISEQEELSEQQKKRKVEVQEAAQYYTEEDWDTIRAKLEANAELTKSLQGESKKEQANDTGTTKRLYEYLHQEIKAHGNDSLKKLTFDELKD
ncbi:hypothetical protein Tco_0080184 [Tanacetum coccineum]